MATDVLGKGRGGAESQPIFSISRSKPSRQLRWLLGQGVIRGRPVGSALRQLELGRQDATVAQRYGDLAVTIEQSFAGPAGDELHTA